MYRSSSTILLSAHGVTGRTNPSAMAGLHSEYSPAPYKQVQPSTTLQEIKVEKHILLEEIQPPHLCFRV